MIQILGSDVDDELYILDATRLVQDCSITVVLACSSKLVTDHFIPYIIVYPLWDWMMLLCFGDPV